jgi:hypothetical protein
MWLFKLPCNAFSGFHKLSRALSLKVAYRAGGGGVNTKNLKFYSQSVSMDRSDQ